MDYILDTNICMYIIKEKPSNVFKKFKKITSENVGISSVTYAEFRYGIEKSSKPDQNKKEFNRVEGLEIENWV